MFTELPGYGILSNFPQYIPVAAIVFIALIFLWHRAYFILWTLFFAALLWGYAAPEWLWTTFAIIAVIFNIPLIRRFLISAPLMQVMNWLGFLPAISDTEKIALDAGRNWFEGNFFSGRPGFKKILKEPWPKLNEEERAFLEGPVEKVCEMTDDWETHKNMDLSQSVWSFLKKEGFFGMAIPKKYGGKGFSAYAMNRVVQKLGSRSIPLTVDVMVPNSLGPAELLVHYGTEEQQDYYLPRLATGQEIPAFALTEPHAGSDASSITASGKVFIGDDGKRYLRLNWDKRYITLASKATLLGLAFKLEDPENLLGKGTSPGITCALIPTRLAGVTNNRRHHPLGVPFINSPTTGKDVVVSVNQIIGGPEQAGNGWRMLMETLAGGRGIYIPALSLAGAKFSARMTGGYSLVREQFGMPIGRFEGIEEILAKIGGLTYAIDAFNNFTCASVDSGRKPAVISAVAKYMASDLNRDCINLSMDLYGGKGIVMGPNNLMAHGYMASPIGITVEGSNVVTRSLIIFGQGLISCHPYAFKLMDALQKGNLRAFDKSLWKHAGMMRSNLTRAVLLSLTRGRLGYSPRGGAVSVYYKKLQWATTTFSITADLALLSLGASLKAREKLSGRFADVFSWLYICTSVLRKFEAEGRKKEDLPFVHWSMQYGLFQIQQNLEGIFSNMSIPLLGPVMRGPVSWWGRLNTLSRMPSDKLTKKIAQQMQVPGEQRERLTRGLYIPSNEKEAVAKLEKAFVLAHATIPAREKLKIAIKKGRLPKKPVSEILNLAVEKNILSEEEAAQIKKAAIARDLVIAVDSFPDAGFSKHVPGLPVENTGTSTQASRMESNFPRQETENKKNNHSGKSIIDQLIGKLKKLAGM